MFLQGPAYPLELLCDAVSLSREAEKHICQDGREITTPTERMFARSAIFTAFNFLESLLIELTQECLASDGVDSCVKCEIEKDLRNGNAKISRIIKEWPTKLGKEAVHGRSEFRSFRELRQLRNNLTHPKLQPLQENELTQDQLLQAASASNAIWAVDEGKKMGRLLYNVFRVSVPPELQ